MNCQSQGKVILRSNDPQDTPLIDLNLLSHPYDMQLAIETIRATIPIIRKSSVIPTDTLLLGPKSLDEADIAVRFDLENRDYRKMLITYSNTFAAPLRIYGTVVALSRWESLARKALA